MKLYIKNLILFCSLVSVLTSCDLDVVPPAEISAENFWKTDLKYILYFKRDSECK